MGTTRSERAAARYAGSALAQANRARAVGVELGALLEADTETLRVNGYGQPVTTLDALWAAGPGSDNDAGRQIDEGREPYLVCGEALSQGMHALLPVWDIGVEKTKVATGKRFGSREYITVVTGRGDALLAPDTLILWR